MAATNPKVMAMIEAELAKSPTTSNAELLEKAKKIDRSVGSLSARQFNARYPLQVKRRKEGGASSTSKASGKRKAGSRTKPKSKTKAKPKSRARRGRPQKSAAPAASGSARGPRSQAARAGAGDRAAVRKILLDYARKVAAADSMTDMVDLVMDVDRYVDRVMKAAG
jgi:hypothetical protein